MSLIHPFVPAPRVREVDRVAVAADPDEAWPVVRAIDVHDVGFARWLFAIRMWPTSALATLRGRRDPHARHARIDDIVAPGGGFALLDEDDGCEVVVGAVGRFWDVATAWSEVPRDQFAGFDEPGWGKLAWGLRVDPRPGGGSWVTFELRATATDDDAWRRLRRSWRLIGRFSRLVRRALLRRLEARLGRASAGRDPLAGDELLRAAPFEHTQRRVIEAPLPAVWSSLAQIGAGHGDRYHLDGGVVLLELEPRHAVVVGSPSLIRGTLPGPADRPVRVTWAFVVEPIGDAATELTVRVRTTEEPELTSMRIVLTDLEDEVLARARRHARCSVPAS